MFKTKATLIALCALTLGTQALAGIDDIANTEKDKKRQELNKKLGIEEPKPAVPEMPKESDKKKADLNSDDADIVPDLQLIGVYGIGNDLRAEVYSQGAVITVRKNGGMTSIGPWNVQDISPSQVVFVRVTGHGKNIKTQKQTIYLSALREPAKADTNTTNPTSPSNMGGMGFPQIPPGMPLPVSTANGQSQNRGPIPNLPSMAPQVPR